MDMNTAIIAAGSAIGAGLAVMTGIGAGIDKVLQQVKQQKQLEINQKQRRYNSNNVTWGSSSRIISYIWSSYSYNPFIR